MQTSHLSCLPISLALRLTFYENRKYGSRIPPRCRGALWPIVTLASVPTFRPAPRRIVAGLSSVPVGVAGFAMIACLAIVRARTADGCARTRAIVRRCGAFMAKICDAVPHNQKALIDPVISRRVKLRVLPGGQSGVGPTKFSTEKFAGDRVRCGADRGDASPCAPRLWWISSRRDPCRRFYCNSNHCGGDGLLSAGLTTTLRRDRVPSNGRRVR
jgi:hypothetical protein